MMRGLLGIARGLRSHGRLSRALLKQLTPELRAIDFGRGYDARAAFARGPAPGAKGLEHNPLREFFEARKSGHGIWKWRHYFDIYHRHFSRFIGREVHILEIGVYSGGSLEMWRDYFGTRCHVYGVDIEEACRSYENDWTTIFIGDQADRGFWKRVREQAPVMDIVVDDGGHKAEQQIVTLEEMLPHLRPGGVFLCEDVTEVANDFHAFVYGLSSQLNHLKFKPGWERELACEPSPLQRAIQSVHHYPFVTVIEKTSEPVEEFRAPKHGTEWQPFFKENHAANKSG